jgi:trans-aconitate 2-methyltransferase
MYTWDAEQYKQSSSNQKQWGTELLSKLGLNGNEHVLDIGCGDGILTAEMAKMLPYGLAVGTDSSEEMINLAEKNFPVKDYPNLRFMMKDARKLDFNGEFDAVFSNACLHWVIDHAPVLQGIKRSLKAGGKMLVQMGGKGNAAEIVRITEKLIKSEKWAGYFNGFTFPYGFYGPEEYNAWLTDLRFNIVRLELIPKDMVFENRQKLAYWIETTWMPYTRAVPEHARKELIGEMADGYIRDHPAQEDGLIHLQMVRLEVEAHK